MSITIYNNRADQVTLENVVADFTSAEVKDPPQILYRMDDRGLRFYYTLNDAYEPTFYGSTTTIKNLVTPTPRPIIEKELDMGKQAFREYRNNRASFGTFWHIQAARLTEHAEYDLDQLQKNIELFAGANEVTDIKGWYQDAWKGLLSWVQFMNDYQVHPLAIEIPLAHPGGYAGTIDLVCQMNAKKYTKKTPPEKRKRIRAIIDWKSGYIFPDHAIQLFINQKIWDHHYPDLPLEGLYNWTWTDWRTRPGYELRNQTDSEEASLIDYYIEIWKTKYFSKPRDIKTSQGLLMVGANANDHWKEIPIWEYVKSKHQKMDGVL